jgi:invasion protein IalB
VSDTAATNGSVSGLLRQKDGASSMAWSLSGYRLIAVGAACLVAGWLAHGLFMQPANAPVVTAFDSWQLICPKRSQSDQSCALVQNVVASQSRATVLRFAISGNTTTRTIDIATVLNVLLPAGLGVKLDDGAMKLRPYRTCDGNACLVTIENDPAFYGDVTHAKRIQIFFAGLDGKTVSADLAMGSFKDAVSALDDAEAKRHSWLRRVLL